MQYLFVIITLFIITLIKSHKKSLMFNNVDKNNHENN